MISRIALKKLAAQHGTPLFVVDHNGRTGKLPLAGIQIPAIISA